MEMKKFKLYEPKPESLKVPNVEPKLRVGIVLEEDQKKIISFSLQDDSFISDSLAKTLLRSKSTYSLELLDEKTFLLKDNNGKELARFIDKVLLSPVQVQRPSPRAGTVIKNIVAGRKFHWQKEIDETFIGDFEFIPANGNIIVVNTIGIEFYSVCAAASEMSGSNSLLALAQAQATAARSWSYVFLESKYKDKPYHLCNDDMSQRYQGTTHLSQEIIDIVEETRGDYLVFDNGDVCPSFYSKSCGGHVESTLNLFDVDLGEPRDFCDSTEIQEGCFDLTKEEDFSKWLLESSFDRKKYFCGMVDDTEIYKYLGVVDEQDSYFRWQHTTPVETIILGLKKKCALTDVKHIKDLKVVKRGSSGRCLEIEVVYENQTNMVQNILLADQFFIRACFHDSFLYSSAFTFEISRDEEQNVRFVCFKGAGWGHGGGMCQIGAVGMALAGFSYREILKHYFPATTLVKAY